MIVCFLKSVLNYPSEAADSPERRAFFGGIADRFYLFNEGHLYPCGAFDMWKLGRSKAKYKLVDTGSIPVSSALPVNP